MCIYIYIYLYIHTQADTVHVFLWRHHVWQSHSTQLGRVLHVQNLDHVEVKRLISLLDCANLSWESIWHIGCVIQKMDALSTKNCCWRPTISISAGLMSLILDVLCFAIPKCTTTKSKEHNSRKAIKSETGHLFLVAVQYIVSGHWTASTTTSAMGSAKFGEIFVLKRRAIVWRAQKTTLISGMGGKGGVWDSPNCHK